VHEFRSSDPPADSLVSETDNLLICTACGTQFDVEDRELLTRCRICDDPRQFVPPTGQAFTTLAELKKGGYENRWKQIDGDDRFWSIWTEPKVAIGQRAILVRTPLGNILWDCITYLDAETIDRINGMGGLAAIVISHPHCRYSHVIFTCCLYLDVAYVVENSGLLVELELIPSFSRLHESP